MSRVQLALNVSNLEESIVFYSTLFGIEPHKRRPGYANFAIAEPPLKLVLIEVPQGERGDGVQGALNHLGVEVESSSDVEASAERLKVAGLATFDERDTAGAPWEIYTVKDENPSNPRDAFDLPLIADESACCTPASSIVQAISISPIS